MAGWLRATRIRRHLSLSKGFFEVALIFIAIVMTMLTTSSAQSGFLSIDCGGTLGNFTDNLQMKWVDDNGTYIKTGKSIEMPPVPSYATYGYDRALLESFRYFPGGRNKYCYELPTIRNVTYLVRANFFMNSSIWTERQPFEFILSINATNWFTLTSSQSLNLDSYYSRQEGIFFSSGEIMYVCLQPVTGEPFISSLELRQLAPEIYSYSGSPLQYLSLLFRYNIGANISTTPYVRFPHDKFDRVWDALDAQTNADLPVRSLSAAPDQTSGTREDVYYVPPEVMNTAWLLSYPDNSVSAGLYSDSVYLTSQGEYAYAILYTEHLNTSDSRVYGVSAYLDGVIADTVNFSHQASMIESPNYILSSNYLKVSLNVSSGGPLESGPTMNACEIYTQSNYNFSTTNPQDDLAITALKNSFDLIDWQGDPCTPVPHDWLFCSYDSPTFEPIRQPCGNTECTVEQGFLRTTYFVFSINLSDLPTNGFDLLNSTSIFLGSLTNISITSSGVDSRLFQLFIYDFCNTTTLKLLDFSYNKIDTVPNWSRLENLTILNLAHNNLTNLLSSSEDLPFPDTLRELNLSYNFITSLPPSWQNTYNDLNVLDISHNQLLGEISPVDKLVQMSGGVLRELYVADNKLSGIFSSSIYFSNLSSLTVADFSQNSIQGTLNLSIWYNALKEAASGNENHEVDTTPISSVLFSFVNNSITNIYPDATAFANLVDKQSSQVILLGGNPYCTGATSYTQRYLCRFSMNDTVERDHKSSKVVLILSICGGIAFVLILCLTFAILWRLWKQVKSLRKIQRALAERKVQPPFYQYSDLRLGTSDFHKDNKLGHGSFGVVYKGVLADGTMLAVKKIFNSQTVQVLDDFLNEVVVITGIKHRNLVQLKGCCIRDKQRMLVYEYAEKGNLAEALWGSRKGGGLSWEQRFDICVGVARGLAYLHEELQPYIIHRDIKPANILLDTNFKPKIADFGLARHFTDEASTSDSTEVAGTMGYLAPEYAMHGHLSEKVDVYSYGIVILEVVSGRKCIDPSLPQEEKFLKDMVCNLIRNEKLVNILQPELRDCCVWGQVICAINIALLCIQHRPEKRPSMSQVVTMLSGDIDIKGFVGTSSNLQPNFKDFLVTIHPDTLNYPLLQRLADDSTMYPMISLDASCSMGDLSFKPSTDPSIDSIELASLGGR